MSKMPGAVAVATMRTFYEIWRSRSQKSEIAAEIGFWDDLDMYHAKFRKV